jgi:hypothetical protein
LKKGKIEKKRVGYRTDPSVHGSSGNVKIELRRPPSIVARPGGKGVVPSRQKKVLNQISPAVREKLHEDLLLLGALYTSYESSDSPGVKYIRPIEIDRAEQMLLDAMAKATLACYEEDEVWFGGEDPQTIARRLVSLLMSVSFSELRQSDHTWMKQLLARPRIASKDNEGNEGLVKHVAQVITARQNAAVWIPKQPPVDTSHVIGRMRVSLGAGQPIGSLMHRVTLDQSQIAKRMGVHKSLVSRIVHGGKHVSNEKINNFLSVVAAALKPKE